MTTTTNSSKHILTTPGPIHRGSLSTDIWIEDENNTMAEVTPPAVTGRIRNASISLLNFNPQPGMWAATGTAIAYAPTLAELREPVAGGENIEFDAQGRSARTVVRDEEGRDMLMSVLSRNNTLVEEQGEPKTIAQTGRTATFAEQAVDAAEGQKHNWKDTTKHGFSAAWKYVASPTGFCITIDGLNIVAWGAMLFFLLLGAAPAMNHPSKDSIDSPRKKWIEIDSQILNALFCVTGFGLAPWRFRDLWWLVKARRKDRYAMGRLSEQDKSWFRPPVWFEEGRKVKKIEGPVVKVVDAADVEGGK